MPDRVSVAILGASDKPDRYSNMLLKRLTAKGHPVYPVHPVLKVIDGVPVYRSLSDLPPGIGILSVYLNAQRSDEIAASILASGIPRVIFNPGAENPALAERLTAAGVEVEEACSLVLSGTGQL
jgi:predicted CoA-binding protein